MPQIARPYTKPKQDGRRKILPSQHELVRQTYKELKSYQKTADKFGVSKRLIIFIVNPEKLQQFAFDRKGAWKKYYSKEARRETMRKYRAKKRKLGLLINVNSL